jgi:hypothetical protein
MTPLAPAPANRLEDLRVALVHLRLGQLALARAELEDLLRRDVLGIDGFAALAEARWRTGDGALAADAALAHLEGGGTDDVALCIAAEAAAADGRPSEARALMDRLPAADAATLDALFAGMPRRAFWPAGPVDRSDPDELRPPSDRGTWGRRPGAPDATSQPAAQAGSAMTDASAGLRTIPGPREVIDATTDLEWTATRRATETAEGGASTPAAAMPPAERPARPRRVRGQLDPAAELERARSDIEAKPERALLRLSLVLRHDPTLAPTVLELLRLRRDPMAALVRGDAQRLLGRHLEAEAAFDAAAESLEGS